MRYSGMRTGLVVAAGLLESCVYRQVNCWWGCFGTAQAMSGGGTWGDMKRRAFE